MRVAKLEQDGVDAKSTSSPVQYCNKQMLIHERIRFLQSHMW